MHALEPQFKFRKLRYFSWNVLPITFKKGNPNLFEWVPWKSKLKKKKKKEV